MLIVAYVESLKLRVGTFIGMAAVLGYVATAPAGLALPSLAILFAVTVMAAGGAGALNHFLDRDLDARMPRTARRPLPSGRIRHPWHVVALGLGLVMLAVSLALWQLNRLVALHVFLGAFTYVVVYTIWLKRRSWLNVVIGGLAGSFAVLAGGALARPELCLPPVIFAAVLFFWSPSHFWSLAIAYKTEYAGARIPMLPAVKGEARTARSILLNTGGLLASSVLPFALGMLGWVYLVLGVVLGGGFLLARNVQLARRPEDRRLALANFHASNLFLLLLFLGVVLDVAARRW
ncbi:MAG: protoheme IX farnesyltransferase [Candidatus Rokubacteria bacterium GWC2_70_24]|nr:MAG: protoheme IX farnesyltransferase [Candidatus Rokubacteria bacterium GWA2_70_23]OGK92453.1 MAG: protoheme IX farnesyltransferase [Candidatus Rokubacteria bacterium GWF2_70_14]OGK93430.1 MAG: protoheme IX farnesyltransferase [Candidatus Rokubacteria bacterium GWC2_70_24]HAM56052.1 protoheme IX farnesyltransferase [Candidatus Rokubacteria bacterium]